MSTPPSFPVAIQYAPHSQGVSQGSKYDQEYTKRGELMKLPDIVESERQGWIVSAQAAAVVAALLCGVEATLLTLIKTDPSNSSPAPKSAFRCLLILSYSALVFNASSTVASLVMLDCLGEIPMLVTKAARKNKGKGAQESEDVDSMDAYLEHFELGFRWRWARRYCLGTLFLGCVCILTQVVVYTWIREATSVASVMSVVCISGAVPLVMFSFPN
ncbi:hypothetical protein FRB94_004969 [Tulasnella sp. JGI-2019a]|nr:hypothetical protein FRB93_009617 [Tulasnella sp. JGI-2019a]KAG9012823.1 hypothetical protein FRB94_004969 [Tulasnella sp. JGI-2019a]KAG9037589.1 hypothetical protein FRB95_004809 [Tulasnella sp. JGI-2019a]